jgi:endonuclease/exonuclease/phosphatase (EEP) superfamily protein YafD
VLTIAATVLAAVALGALALRYHSTRNPLVLGAIAGTPLLLLAAPVAAVLALVARDWIILAVAVFVGVLGAATQVHLYTADDPPDDGRRLVVMTANLWLGNADTDSLVAAVRRHHIDLLMVQELSAAAEQRLTASGLDDLLPHHRAQTSDVAAAGTGLWSRYPLSDVRFPDQFAFAMVTARVRVPGAARPITAAALHLAGPVPRTADWQQDIRRLPAELRELPADAPVIVGGDFNATFDVAQFRRVLAVGYADAADQAGAGNARTYPADRWFPALLAIDHVLTRGGAVATDVRTVSIANTDHRALLAVVTLPS